MRVFSDEYGVIQLLAGRELAQVSLKVTKTTRVLNRPKLAKLDRAVRHLVWREALRILTGDLQQFTLRHLENLDRLLTLQTGSLIHLPKGVTARREYDRIVLRVGAAPGPPKPVRLPVPGSVRFGETKLSATVVRGRAPRMDSDMILVDREETGPGLLVRSPKPGDRFKPAGMRGSKLVSDLLTDAKVPRDERPWVPVVVKPGPRSRCRGEIEWVAGFRADRRLAARPKTPRVLLKLEKTS